MMLNEQMLNNLTKEELIELRNNLVQAWAIQRSEYQEKQLKLVNNEIKKRNSKED